MGKAVTKKVWEIPSFGSAGNRPLETPPVSNDLGDELEITSGSSINWYFGRNAGLRFEPDGNINVLNDGLLNQDEGAYTVSDAKGNLLFYTDGEVIFNRDHQVLESGLFGNDSSATSAVVAVQDGTPFYWIFTVDRNVGTRGLNYTIVDMTLNSGLGGVATIDNVFQKNINLQPQSNSTEKLGLVQHKNGKDWWIIGHGFGNDQFYAYLLTKDGLDPTPVNTNIGLPLTDVVDRTGFIKDSFGQDKLAHTTFGSGPGNKTVELFDFDRSTGVLSNYKLIGTFDSPYGVEFTVNDKFLYFTETQFAQFTRDRIYRYDIENDTVSLYWERLSGSTSQFHIGMQIANNGKIYVSFNNRLALSFIDDPENDIETLKIDALDISPGRALTGLPYFPKAYLKNDPDTTIAPTSPQAENIAINADQTTYPINNTNPQIELDIFYFGIRLVEGQQYTTNAQKTEFTLLSNVPVEAGETLVVRKISIF